jgi:hypothetical protein
MKPNLLKYLFFIVCLPVFGWSQIKVTLSGNVKNSRTKSLLPYVSVTIKKANDSSFLAGTITNESGMFSLPNITTGNYILDITYTGHKRKLQPVLIGKLSSFLDVGTIEMEEEAAVLSEVTVTAELQEVSDKMDKKSFSITNNISQGGGSVLQAMRNLPGITVNEEGKVLLRGSDKVTILIDGKQTALSGFGNQSGLDNLPASAIERIEIINNPSAKYDANGNAGIINIIYKKSRQQGFNGKIGFMAGAGALWIKKENFPGIRPQYQGTPKFNPSLSLNYRKNKINAFVQGDYLYNKTLNRNDFTDRIYANGDTIKNQVNGS